jgi:phospholipase/carboxylesterase
LACLLQDLEDIPVTPALKDDEAGLSASTKIVHAIIDEAIDKGHVDSSEDIVLGGFSQGAAMACLAGYTYPKKLRGIVCLSGWAALKADLVSRVSSGANAKTAAFVGHGTFDSTVETACGEDMAERLKESGTEVEFVTYPEAHGSHPDGQRALRAWLADLFKLDVD